jgi:hypothetical protein
MVTGGDIVILKSSSASSDSRSASESFGGLNPGLDFGLNLAFKGVERRSTTPEGAALALLSAGRRARAAFGVAEDGSGRESVGTDTLREVSSRPGKS